MLDSVWTELRIDSEKLRSAVSFTEYKFNFFLMNKIHERFTIAFQRSASFFTPRLQKSGGVEANFPHEIPRRLFHRERKRWKAEGAKSGE